MNMFGKLAEFMWKYQDEIEIAFIIILAIAAIIFIGRIVRAGRKKRELLSQINDTVTQINTAVSSINDKQKGVVYIDNRGGADTRPQEAEEETAETAKPDDDASDHASDDAGQEEQKPAEVSEAAEEADGTQENDEKKDAQPVRKYFSRDCAVSKNGKYYTLEELNDQIRE